MTDVDRVTWPVTAGSVRQSRGESAPSTESTAELLNVIDALLVDVPFHDGAGVYGFLPPGSGRSISAVIPVAEAEARLRAEHRGTSARALRWLSRSGRGDSERGAESPATYVPVHLATRSFYRADGIPGSQTYTGFSLSVYQQKLVTADGEELADSNKTYLEQHENKDADKMALVLPVENEADLVLAARFKAMLESETATRTRFSAFKSDAADPGAQPRGDQPAA